MNTVLALAAGWVLISAPVAYIVGRLLHHQDLTETQHRHERNMLIDTILAQTSGGAVVANLRTIRPDLDEPISMRTALRRQAERSAGIGLRPNDEQNLDRSPQGIIPVGLDG